MSAAGGELLSGMILKSAPIGDYDRRVEILTREKGRISAFARGARKPGSPLMAVASQFVTGTFRVFFGKNSNQLLSADVTQFFSGLRSDMEGTCYGSYFMEVMELCTGENTQSSDLLLLGYQALRALSSDRFDNRLVRCVFEIKAVMLEGEFDTALLSPAGAPEIRENAETGDTWDSRYVRETAGKEQLSEAARYTLEFLYKTPVTGVFSFRVSEEVLRELMGISRKMCARTFPHHFASLDVLDIVAN